MCKQRFMKKTGSETSPLDAAGLDVPLSAGWVAAELPGDWVAVLSDGISWLDVGVSSTGQIMNHLFPV